MRIRDAVSRVILVVWWISLFYLGLGFLGELSWFVKYLSDPNNPARYEYGIGAAYIFMYYLWPAAVGVLFAALVPGTSLSTSKKLIGAALLLGCIALLFLFKGSPL